LNESELKKVVIAYEPVWAIGTGVSATEEQAGEAHDFIRIYLIENFGKFMNNTYLLYGGSMKPEKCRAIIKTS
jgi:triosephosphate isomerase